MHAIQSISPHNLFACRFSRVSEYGRSLGRYGPVRKEKVHCAIKLFFFSLSKCHHLALTFMVKEFGSIIMATRFLLFW